MLDGCFPSDWRRCRLSEVATLQTGLAKGRKNIRNPVERPYLRVANVQDGHLDLSEVKRIVLGREETTRFELQTGDVLLTEGGDFDKLGRGTIWRGEIPGCVHQNHIFAVRPNRSQLLPEFLAAWTASSTGRRYFLGCAKQTTNLASVNATQVRHLPLALPSTEEQQRIVSVVGLWDVAIRDLRRLIRAKRRLKRGLMQQLLTGTRRFQESRPSRWVERPLGDYLVESRELASTGVHARKLTVKLYGRGVVANPDRRPGSQNTQYHRRRAGQFIYSKLDFLNGAFGIVPGELDGYETTLDLPAFDVAPELHAPWLVHLTTWPGFYRRHLRLAAGGRKARRIGPGQFLSIRVSVPPFEEQRCIATLLTRLEREILLLELKATLVERQKAGLMQKLLTGRVRVKV